MKKVIEGHLNSKGMKIAVVAGRFNELITSKLIGGADDCFIRHGGDEKSLSLVWVPGAYEMPLIARKLAKSGEYDAVVCVGAVIRGGTPHFEYVSSEVAKGVASVSLEADLPVIFGVLTTDSIDQAIERAGTKAGNKGWEAMLAAIEMVSLYKNL